jgi:hypothetical protein
VRHGGPGGAKSAFVAAYGLRLRFSEFRADSLPDVGKIAVALKEKAVFPGAKCDRIKAMSA